MFDNHPTYPSIESLSDGFKGVLLDAYGVFWGGNEFGLIPGSKEIMEKLVLKNKIVGILSNSTQLASKEIHKLAQQGLLQGKHFHFLVTSGEIARNIFLHEKLPFETPTNTFCLFLGRHPKFSSHEEIFQGTVYHETADRNEADFIYLSVPHMNGQDQTDPEIFREEVEKLIAKKLPMICPNPDQFAHEGIPPKAVVRQGSIASLYEKIGGQVFYIGKPYHNAYEIAMNSFMQYHLNAPSEILMVGDTPETDIRGARQFGMRSALITKTGIMADRISKNGLEKSLNALFSYDIPDYFLGEFANGL